ncbi:MAG: hypothetical protein KZQ64_10815, partial [gamma proteobacterium symbiont of Bathyaustriella thionipta]|nr:hypothetical protein [gamma proteobacterium symbiont of Bathyaustriella thionipta]
IERDIVYLSSLINIGCYSNRRPFHWWWAEKNSIEIPGMGKNTALIFYLTQHYLEPLLPKSSLNYLNPNSGNQKLYYQAEGKKTNVIGSKKFELYQKQWNKYLHPFFQTSMMLCMSHFIKRGWLI